MYLALLDQLSPPDIQQLQRKGKMLPRLVCFPNNCYLFDRNVIGSDEEMKSVMKSAVDSLCAPEESIAPCGVGRHHSRFAAESAALSIAVLF